LTHRFLHKILNYLYEHGRFNNAETRGEHHGSHNS
jgi:hypothetical protein